MWASIDAADNHKLDFVMSELEVKMSKTLKATFDGEVLRPDEPIELEPNTRVRITIESANSPEEKSKSFLKTARSLKLEGPSDWSAQFDDYLYGREDTANE